MPDKEKIEQLRRAVQLARQHISQLAARVFEAAEANQDRVTKSQEALKASRRLLERVGRNGRGR